MTQNLQWTSLQERRITSRITLLYTNNQQPSRCQQVRPRPAQPTPLTSHSSPLLPDTVLHHQPPTTVLLPQNHQGIEQPPSKFYTVGTVAAFKVQLAAIFIKHLSSIFVLTVTVYFSPLFHFFRFCATPWQYCSACCM